MKTNTLLNRLISYMDKKNYDFNVYNGIADNGLDDKTILITANWNNIPDKLHDFIDNVFKTHWIDEYASCEVCNKAIKTSPNCYGWEPGFIVTEYGLICQNCIKDDEGIQEEIIEYYINETNKAVPSWFCPLLKNHGFICYSIDDYCEKFESGFHPGQTDDPVKIAKDIQKTLPDYDFIFKIDSIGQFDVHFSVFLRKQ
jgi:hypothetical protein